MPSEAVLEQKKQVVAELTEQVKNACIGVIVDYKGINVADDTAIRKEMREAGIKYCVVKNTLLKLALADAGIEGLDDVLNGTTAIALSTDDYAAAPRILGKFADAHDNFNVKAGFMDGKSVDIATIDSLAKLPTREVLLATVLNAFNAPIAAFARAIQAVVDKDGEASAE